MKNVIKKVSAIAMAFTLLGTGSVVTKTVSSDATNSYTITANAAKKCSHKKTTTTTVMVLEKTIKHKKSVERIYHDRITTRCVSCGKIISEYDTAPYHVFTKN